MTTRKFAADDAELNRAAIVTSRRKVYVDLDNYFLASSTTEDVYLSKDAAAVKQSIRNLVLTNHYERPFQPFKGGNVRATLFQNMDAFALNTLENTIRDAITSSEPRAKVLRVDASAAGDNGVVLTLEFQILSTREVASITVTLQRLR